MKLRFTTKCFIFSTVLFLTFRILQIIFLTQPQTAFLKPQFLWINIIGTVVCLLPTIYTAADDFYAFRCPERVGRTGLPGALICAVAGILLLVPAIFTAFSGTPNIFKILFPALGCIGCVIIAASELLDLNLAKPTFLLILSSLLYEFISAYSVYTGKPLRVRTVFEILALTLAILYFLNLSKANSNIKKSLNFRLVYPLGSLAATFCALASIPEAFCHVIGYSEHLTVPCVSTVYIFGIGAVITYLTVASNTFSNTKKIKSNN